MNNIFMKIVLVSGLFLVGCGENEDGSDPETYSSCYIKKSNSTDNDKQVKDLDTCWDGVDYKEKNLAEQWCSQKINQYINNQNINYDIKYAVASTNCLNNKSMSDYSIEVEVEGYKTNGDSWDIFSGSPDVLIYIDGKLQKSCSDGFKCKLDFSSNKTKWNFTIYDKDVSENDLIGSGSCKANETCIIGQSLIEITEHN